MNPLIVQHLDAIRALAREFGVARLEVFGSACTNEFDLDRSDVEFIVDHSPDFVFGPWHSRYFELKERPEALLGRPDDLVMAGALRKSRVSEAANETRRLLYAA